MEKAADGVYELTGYSNSFIIDGDQGVTLVDTGMPKRSGAIAKALDDVGRDLSDVAAIVITHGHVDHFGSAAAVKAKSEAEVVASAGDAPYVLGHEKSPLPPFTEKYRFLKPILNLLPGADGVGVDHEIGGDEHISIVSDLSAIQTPGHTPGHMSLLLDRSGGILFVGDAAVADKAGNIKRGFMNISTETFDGSLRKIAGHDFEIACFGHAKTIENGASGAFRRFVATIDS